MIAALLLAALLDFGPERPIAPNSTVGLAPHGRERARVAASDHGSLIVWSDGRTGNWEVYGTRLDRTGAVLDEQGIAISKGIAGDVVWTGTTYLVAYSIHPIVYVRTLTPEGILGAPIPIVDVDWATASTVRLATDGTTILLMTNSGRGAILGLDGMKRREMNFGVLPRAEWALDIAVANDGYGLATVTTNGVAFRRIHADRDEPAQILPSSSKAATVGLASDGTHFVAAYDDVNFLRVNRIGDPLATPVTPFAAAFPKLIWRGDHYLVTFTRPANIDAMAVRVSATAEPLSGIVQFATATPPSQPDADRRPDGTGVAAWVSGSRVEAGFFDNADAAPSDVKPVSFSAPAQEFVRVDAQDGDIFTMWLETGPEGQHVRLGRGAGGPAVTIATGSAWPVDVVVDGNVVWAVWNEFSTGVAVRRYTRGLVPIDAAPVRATGQSENGIYDLNRRTRVAAGGGTLLLVADLGDRDPGIEYTFLREVDGALTADLREVRMVDASGRTPAVAWNGSEFVVVWSSADGWIDLWQYYLPQILLARRIGADGEFRDAGPVTLSSDPNVRIGDIRAVRAGNEVVVAWQTTLIGATSIGRNTFAMRVGGEQHAIPNPQHRRLRDIATLADRFLMLWTNDDAESVLLANDLTEVERGIVPGAADDLDLASTGGRPVVAYARIAEEYGRVFRAFVRSPIAPRSRAVRR
jgi:hypothetical protein